MKRVDIVKIVLLLLATVFSSTNAWGKTVTLSWDASPSVVAGYKIYYDTSSSTPLDGSGATEGSAPIDVGNVLTYIIHGLSDDSDHYFAVSAYDSSGNESTYSNTVHSPAVVSENSAPVLAPISNRSVLEGAIVSFNLSGSDSDGDTLTYSSENLPTGAGLNSSTGAFTWAPAMNQSGSYSITFTVTDGTASDSKTVVINVIDVVSNNPPILDTISNKGVNEGETQYVPISATDSDGDTLSYNFTGMPTGASFDLQNHTLVWPTTFDQAGVYPITVTVSDGTLSDSESFTITVNNVNRPPILNAIGSKAITENSQITFTISGVDADGDSLSYSASDFPDGASFDSATRSFNWIPEFQSSENTRVVPVTFTVSDGVAEDSEVVTINVINLNRAPVLDPIGSQILTEGDIYNLVINAADPDGNALIYTASPLPSGAVFTPSTRSFSWIPGNDQAGTYNVTFSASDGTATDSETVVFTVNNGNEAPVLDVIGGQTIAEGALLTFVVTASDVNGDPLTYSASGLPSGAVFNVEQQRFSWTPDFTKAGNFTVNINVTDGSFSDSESVEITVTNTNRPLVISGTPANSVMATTNYSFTPVTSDSDGDALTFSIVNKPSWATFDLATGTLSGVPSEAQVGSTVNIVIGASDSTDNVSLLPFSIDVIAYVQKDSDDDGVLDHLDAFPNDSNEWLDTDGDQIGNNSDQDDDNDGITDQHDGFPLDNTKSGWTISATTSAGGFLTPEGETSILYGGFQHYQLTPMSGYYINDLLVDNVSVGLVSDFNFDDVRDHHTIAAIFAPIPAGLSHDPTAPALAGIERVDGGDDHNNLVDSKPKQDLDYRFRIVLRDSAIVDQRRVFLILDGYKYLMNIESGTLTNGADYIYTTRFGPAFSHQFYFVAEDISGQELWRYPQNGDLPGPTVELLNGKNVLGVVADINAYALDVNEVFNDSAVYRWNADSGSEGSFDLADSGAPITSGEGYVLKRTEGMTLPDLGVYSEIGDSSYGIPIKSGWNLISNPYGGNVRLADIKLRLGDAVPISWLTASAENLLVDVVYSYLGTDWGNKNEFSSAAGNDSATLIPWIGYWVYLNPTEQEASLIISKPLQ